MSTPEPQLEVRPQRVVCAAVRHRTNGRVICGARHFDTVMRDQINQVKTGPDDRSWYSAEQGFIDQFGKFLTREEAFQIATEQKQIIYQSWDKEAVCLYSEDLY